MPSEDAERRRRAELGYQAWSCALCRTRFLTLADAQKHFTSRFSRHQGQAPAILENLDPDKEARLAVLLRPSDEGSGENRTEIEAALALMDSTTFTGEQHETSGADAPSVSTRDCPALPLPMSVAESSDQSRESSGRGESSTWSSGESLPVATLGGDTPSPCRPRPSSRLAGGGFKRKCRLKRCLDCGLSIEASMDRYHLSRFHLDDPLFSCRRCPWADRRSFRMDELPRHAKGHGISVAQCFADRAKELASVLKALSRRLLTVTNVVQMMPRQKGGIRMCRLCGEAVDYSISQARHVTEAHLDAATVLGCKECPFNVSTELYETYLSAKSSAAQLMKEHAWNGHKSRDFVDGRQQTDDAISALRRRCFPKEESSRCQQCDNIVTSRLRELHVSIRHQHLPSFSCRLCEDEFFLPHRDIVEDHLWTAHKAEPSELTFQDTSAEAGFSDTLLLCFPKPSAAPAPRPQNAGAWRCAECSLLVQSQRTWAWNAHARKHHWEGWLYHCLPCKVYFDAALPLRHTESAHGILGDASDLVLSRCPALMELAKRLAAAATPQAGSRLRCALGHCGRLIGAGMAQRKRHVVIYHWDGVGALGCGACGVRCPTLTLRHRPDEAGERVRFCRLAWPAVRALRDKAFPSA